MFRISLKSFLAKKFRLISTATAVTLGIAFLAGSLIFIDTLGKTFDDLVVGILEHTDAQVRSRTKLDTQFEEIRGPIDASLLDEVEAVDGVAEAAGSIEGFAQIVGSDGEVIGNPGAGPPTLGFNWTDVEDLNPMRLIDDGRPPQGPDEVVIDKASADTGELAVGDRVTILLEGPPREFEIVGIARFGDADSAAGASLAIFDHATAQEVLGLPGQYSVIDVVAEDGINQAELQARLFDVMPSTVEVITGEALIEENQTAISDALGFFNTFMLVFAGIALFVGAFIIYNTFSIIVAQRTKEMALLRALGASGKQILGSVLFEAIVVGVLASIAGIAAGLGVAVGLKRLMAFFAFDITTGPLVFLPATAITAMVVGVVVTAVSAVVPAVRAARTPPMAALRESASDTSSHSLIRLVSGAVLTAAGAGAILYGLFGSADSPLQTVGIGAVMVFLGIAALGPILAGPVAWAIGRVLTPLRGFPGQLAGENAGRNPKRTSATASALMIGIALVGFITILATSTTASIDKIIDDSVTGDIVVSSPSFGQGGLSPELAASLKEVPELETVAPVRVAFAEIAGQTTTVFASDPAEMVKVTDVGITDGDLANLRPTELAVHDERAEAEGWVLGREVRIRFADTGQQIFTVAALYTNDNLGDDFLISTEAYDNNHRTSFDFQIFIETAAGVTPEEARTVVESVTEPYANATVLDMSEYKEAQAQPVNNLLGLVYALLGLSVVIAVLGIANTLALSIVERTHELGLLRAVGMSRRQLRSAIRWESVIIATLGTGLGVGIGVFFGWAVVTALQDEGISELSIPPLQMVIIAGLGAAVGILAAIGPARRAAKLNVLDAIATE